MLQETSRSRGVNARLVVGLSVGLGAAALLALLGSAARVRRTLRLQRAVGGDDDSSLQRSTATYVVLEIQVGVCACVRACCCACQTFYWIAVQTSNGQVGT